MNNYEAAIKTLAHNGDKSEFDRADMVIKEMSRVISNLLDYRHTATYYNGDQDSVITDKMNTVANSLSVMLGDIDMYMEAVGITDKVMKKKENRINKLADKVGR